MKGLIKKWSYGNDLSALLIRLVFGLSLFYGHGLGKFSKLSGEIQFADPIGLGEELSFYLVVFAEGICSLLIVFGLLTRLALIPLIITMIVIVFVIHFPEGLKGFEKPLLFLAGYTALLFTGPGRFSLDHLLFKK